ncbi:flagellin [uncultured Algimonas sp.]|uniref:flagellin n=1 Tax=uncultured Algimonas sp. TaxID=1547920 RepID=UPI002625AAC0|nr:flagellin [uncultured Algimonas sp.]
MNLSMTPDVLFNNRQARQNALIRSRLETAGQEAITGKRSDVVAATNGRVGDAFLLDKAAADLDRQRGTAKLAKSRMDTAAGAITLIRETVTGLGAEGRVTLSQGGPNDIVLLADNAADRLAQTMSALGRRSGTRHLFSGTNTVGGPLAATETLQAAVNAEIAAAPDAASAIAAIERYFNDAGAGFETDIYQGSVEDGPRLHISDDLSYDPIPKGDDPLFRDIMRGYAMIAGATQFASKADRIAMMDAGLSLLEKAGDSAIVMETRLGAAQQSLERATESFDREASLIAIAQNDMLGRDPFEAASEIQALEQQLQASYTVTGRLGSLSLANFLR